MMSVFDHPWFGALFGDDDIAALWAPEAQRVHPLAFEAAYSRALVAVGPAPDVMALTAAQQLCERVTRIGPAT